MLVKLLPTDKPLDDVYEPLRRPVDETEEIEPIGGANRFCGDGFAER